jgi:sRNA-binding protein
MYTQEHRHVIAILARLFPKTFFENARLRVPLKLDIEADVEQQGCNEVLGMDVRAAIEFYRSHVGYQMCLEAPGRFRVDLDGIQGNKVTELEARAARQKVGEIHSEMTARAAANPMVRVGPVRQGHDLLGKVTIPREAPREIPLVDPRSDKSVSELLASATKKLARATSLADSEDDEFKALFLRKVLTKIQLDIDALLMKL